MSYTGTSGETGVVGVTDGIWDTWSEGSHEKPVTLGNTQGGEERDKTLAHITNPPCTHTHTHKVFVVNPKSTP